MAPTRSGLMLRMALSAVLGMLPIGLATRYRINQDHVSRELLGAFQLAGSNCPELPGYIFYEGKDLGVPSLKSIKAASSSADKAAVCDKTPGCVSFNTQGELKSSDDMGLLESLSEVSSGACTGVYLKSSAPEQWGGLSSEVISKILQDNSGDTETASHLLLESMNKIRSVLESMGYGQAMWPELGAPILQEAALKAGLKLEDLGGDTASGRGNDMASGVADASLLPTLIPLLSAAAFPEWDSRDPKLTGGANLVCKVQNQGPCGSCVAFSVAGAAETAMAAAWQMDCDVSLSAEWLFFCASVRNPKPGRQPMQTCQTGWVPEEAFQIVANQGIPYEHCFPYNSISPVKQCNAAPRCGTLDADLFDRSSAFLSPGYMSPGGSFSPRQFSSKQLVQAKAFLRAHGSLLTGFIYHEDFFKYTGGVYKWDKRSKEVSGHVTMVVGYSDSGQYWIGKNSWGSDWGEEGFFRVSYEHPTFMNSLIWGVEWTPLSRSVLDPEFIFDDSGGNSVIGGVQTASLGTQSGKNEESSSKKSTKKVTKSKNSKKLSKKMKDKKLTGR